MRDPLTARRISAAPESARTLHGLFVRERPPQRPALDDRAVTARASGSKRPESCSASIRHRPLSESRGLFPELARVSRLRHGLEVLHGTANTLDLYSKAPERIDGNHSPVGIEGNHVREHSAKRKRFRGFA